MGNVYWEEEMADFSKTFEYKHLSPCINVKGVAVKPKEDNNCYEKQNQTTRINVHPSQMQYHHMRGKHENIALLFHQTLLTRGEKQT